MSRVKSLLLALTILAPSFSASTAGAATCPNDALNGSEACDTTKYAGYAGTPNCSDVCGAGTVGVVGCDNTTCTIDCSGCVLPVDAGAPSDAAAADSTTPPAGTCRSYSHTDTYFEAGSLIIPMDSDCQSAGGELKAYGLVWQLLRQGIRVSWILDTGKSAPDAADFTISGTANPIVERLARSGDYDTFAAIPGPKCVPTTTHDYMGSPMVIAASDADAALQILYQGSMPDDPTVTYGWGLTSPALDFSIIEIHRAKEGFTAPVLRTSTTVPRPVALMQTSGWLDAEVLDYAEMNFTGSGGTAASSGLIYDNLTESDITSTTVLTAARYQMAWINGDAVASYTTSAVYSEIADFVADGSGVLASGNAITALECNDCASNDCSSGTCSPPSQFQGTTGIVAGPTGHGADTPPIYPGSPITQIGDLAYHGLAEEVQSMLPQSTWKPCTTVVIKNGAGNPLMSVRDDASMGPVYYITGRNYDSGGAALKRAMQRTVLNLIFLATETIQDEKPITYELTRSTPIVVEPEDLTEFVSFQGTYDWPEPLHGHYFNPDNVAAWRYPIVAGHLRAYDFGAISVGALNSFDSASSLWSVWAGTSHVHGSGCSRLNSSGCSSRSDCTGITVGSQFVCNPTTGRNVYTASGTSLLAREDFTTANAATLESALGMSSTAHAERLIEAVRAGPLGGIDQSSPALVVHKDEMTFENGYVRPAVLYVGGLDGMLHAFEVRDVEKKTGSYGSELWTFVLPDQLGNLRENKQGVQGSPAVVDVYGDFVDDSAGGTAGQDGTDEWITLLTITAGSYGRAIYGIDVTAPRVSGTDCPTGRSCVHGPNPLWVVDAQTDPSTSSPTYTGDMGGALTGALGVIRYNGDLTPVAVMTTNIAGCAELDSTDCGSAPHCTWSGTTCRITEGGLRFYVIRATDGEVLWKRSIPYSCTLPNGLLKPNDVPPPVMLVDKEADKGYQTHAFFGDLQGRVWEIDLNYPNYSPRLRFDANYTFGGDSTKCNYPIAGPMSLFRDSSGMLNGVVVTGGISWAPADGTQRVVSLRYLNYNWSYSTQASYVYELRRLPAGERVYTAPIVANQDVYIQTSEGLVDQAMGWTAAGAAGTAYRVNVSNPWSPGAATSLGAVGMTGSSLGFSKSGKLVSTSARGVAALANTGATTTSTAPQNQTSGEFIGKLRLWLPMLK